MDSSPLPSHSDGNTSASGLGDRNEGDCRRRSRSPSPTRRYARREAVVLGPQSTHLSLSALKFTAFSSPLGGLSPRTGPPPGSNGSSLLGGVEGRWADGECFLKFSLEESHNAKCHPQATKRRARRCSVENERGWATVKLEKRHAHCLLTCRLQLFHHHHRGKTRSHNHNPSPPDSQDKNRA